MLNETFLQLYTFQAKECKLIFYEKSSVTNAKRDQITATITPIYLTQSLKNYTTYFCMYVLQFQNLKKSNIQ